MTKGRGVSPQRGLVVHRTANANLQNSINISIIFNYVRNRGATHRARIARDLGISAPAVSRAVERLANEGYLIESERVQIENGKKASLLSINAGRGFIVGIDLLPEPIEMALSDFSGKVLHTGKGPLMGEGETDFPAFLAGAIDGFLASIKGRGALPEGPLLAIGIAVPAVVEPESGHILSAILYRSISPADFGDRISRRYGVPVYVENIANLAAIGEWKRGHGREARNLVFIEISNGIGAGLIIDGDLFRGRQGSAGEIGYFLTQPGALGHDSSRRGYLESVASTEALGRRARRPPQDAGPAGSAEQLRLLCAAAASGDEAAGTAIREAVGHLAVSIINIMLLVDPEIVVIGGSACELPEGEAQIVRPLIAEVLANYPFTPCPILMSSLGARASLYGALQFALDSLVLHSYPYRL